MDSGGNIYAAEAIREQMERETGVPIRKMRRPEKMPKSAIPIEDIVIATALAGMGRPARLLFHGSRRNGASETVAFARAKAMQGQKAK